MTYRILSYSAVTTQHNYNHRTTGTYEVQKVLLLKLKLVQIQGTFKFGEKKRNKSKAISNKTYFEKNIRYEVLQYGPRIYMSNSYR